jgi:hypothetical protein
MQIDELAAAIGLGRIRITNRADEELRAHRLTMDEVCAAAARGRIVEELSAEERPYPSCRVASGLPGGAPIETVWGWNARTGWAVLVNAYRVAAPETGGPEEKSDEMAV